MLDVLDHDISMGLSRDLGQASEVRGGGLKLGFAMQTLEGIRFSCSCPSRPFHTSTPGLNTKPETRVETSSFPQAGRFHLPAENVNLVYRASTRLSSALNLHALHRGKVSGHGEASSSLFCCINPRQGPPPQVVTTAPPRELRAKLFQKHMRR